MHSLTTSRDAGMVILPAYYAASFRQDPSQIVQYYIDICAGSPVSGNVHRSSSTS